jgi:hypothetical protein
MTTVEIIIAAIGGQSTLTAAGVGAWKIVQRWQAGRERVRLAEIAAGEREDEREERTEDHLWNRLKAVDGHVKDCHDERKRDRAECDERVGKLEDIVRKSTADITGRIDIAAERLAARRSPPPARPVLPPPRPLRAIPPPRPVRSRRDEPDDDGGNDG